MAQVDTILIVDDDPDTREGMRLMLEGEGYLVATAGDGRQALEALLAGLRPCVIVMDLAMPIMNGMEFRTEQLKHAEIAGIPFIAYATLGDTQDAVRGLQGSECIEKPAEFHHMLSIIRQHCNH